MSGMLDYMRLCRLCLVKDKVDVPIFGEESDVRQIFLKISACLPVKVSQEDNLPKKICDTCLYKVDLLYQFWNTTVNAEKQLIQWLGEVGVDVNMKHAVPPPLQMMVQSHAHPHSMNPETIILKEERQDPEIKAIEQNLHVTQGYQHQQNIYPGYDIYPQQMASVSLGAGPAPGFQQTAANIAKQESDVHQPVSKRTRGRPPKKVVGSSTAGAAAAAAAGAAAAATAIATTIAATATTTSSSAASARSSTGESMDESSSDRMLANDDSDEDDDDMDTTASRVAKEEAESDEEYVDNPECLEPTTFVGVPSTSAASGDTHQPGPSGIHKPPTNTSTSTSTGTTAQQIDNWKASSFDTTSDFSLLPLDGKLYKCEECSKTFTDRVKFRRHMVACHNGQKHSCDVCDKKFTIASNLKIHKKYYCLTKESNPDSLDFKCPQCGKAFSNSYKLEVHVRVHTRSYVCQFCGKILASISSWRRHTFMHSGEKPFLCDVCNKAFRTDSQLKVHKFTHSKDRPFSCEECGNTFRSKYALHTHKKIHADNRIFFPCDICHKVYASKSGMTEHRRTKHGVHLDEDITKEKKEKEEKEYPCSKCDKVFSSRHGLNHHTMSKHDNISFTCEICGKSVTSKASLISHYRSHSGEKPFSCDVCHKKFTNQKLLRVHARIHTGDKPFKCSECGKCFTQQSSLIIHKRYHSGERPYTCTICQDKFITNTVMKTHAKLKHGMNIDKNLTFKFE